MAYTTQQAIATLEGYLQEFDIVKTTIEDTKNRGFIIETADGEKSVLFVYPLVHKQDNTKNYFDTRDSGAHERSVAWKYAQNHGFKYFCLGVNDQVEKYQDYVFSLECQEKDIEKISGTKDGVRNGPGNQIIIPNDYVPRKQFERIKNRLGIYIAAVHKDSLWDYIEKYDNRPYIMEEEITFEGNLFDTNDELLSSDVLSHNLFGIHMKEKNTALSEDDPHICIGWSKLGDLSDLTSKEELADLFSNEWPNAKSKSQGQNVGQVWRFVNEMQIGDYVVFADGNLFHIGRIESEYYYNESVDENQSPDYKNTRKVEWLKKNIQRSEVSAALHRSLMTAMSVWTMNDYRAAIADLLNGTYVSDEEYVEESENVLPIRYNTGFRSDFALNRIVFGAPGTGKSYTVNRDAKLLIGEDNETDYERVTFHPDYSYANFVGTYKPVMVEKDRQFSMDGDTDYVVSILNDKGKSAQEKYDVLYERFRGDGLTRLPVLLGLYTDENFKTRKQDGTDTAEDNSVERNHGRAIRKYVNLIDGKEETGDIAYEYVPGPFMRVYVNALKSARTDNPKPFLLIIEEINRANVAAVFGDIFQLLDRNDDNVSEYPIQASEDIKKYLAKELGGKPKDYTKIRIPDNMFIWATMNSADQGVFPMDTAFKRRWDFTYLGIDDSDDDIRGKYVEVGSSYNTQCIEWNSLRKAINDFLAEEKINEDKQLGPYYVSRDIVVPPDGGNIIDSKRFCDVFKYKVLMYLFEDAAKQKRVKLFSGLNSEVMRYSEICREFDLNGIGIFNSSIQSKVDTKEIVTNNYELDEPGLPNIDE